MDNQNLYSKYSGVIELTNKDFKNTTVINKNFKDMYGLITFYAPWCIHCRQMVELWSDLALQFRNLFAIGAVNCEHNTKTCINARIRYYPTIKFVTKKGNMHNYTGKIDRDSLIYFIYSKI